MDWILVRMWRELHDKNRTNGELVCVVITMRFRSPACSQLVQTRPKSATACPSLQWQQNFSLACVFWIIVNLFWMRRVSQGGEWRARWAGAVGSLLLLASSSQFPFLISQAGFLLKLCTCPIKMTPTARIRRRKGVSFSGTNATTRVSLRSLSNSAAAQTCSL